MIDAMPRNAVAWVLCMALPAFAQVSFETWLLQFQAATAKGDAAAVARGARFPMQWENGPIRQVQSAAELTTRFDALFTAEIRQQIASQKPEPLGDSVRAITWKARGNEYSLYFRANGAGWALDGLSEGPP